MTARNIEIAQTIAQQLGGARFRAMTGAKNLLAIDAGLQFQLPAGFASNKATHVRITLTAADLYTMRFLSVRKCQVIERGQVCDLYADQLAREFTEATGLYTSL